ncbi:MAG TPA: YlxR family protein [Desulfomonilaceae bacterium]|nr:YlxR family protein [Desulfomonilaceae bacterium]
MKRGHVPIRQCVGCRGRRPAKELIRLAISGDELVVSSQKNKTQGRGCYVCPDEKCAELALRKGTLARALRGKISVPSSKEALLKATKKKG